MIILGIDPGMTGALCVIGTAGPRLIACIDMPVLDFGTKTRKVVDARAVAEWTAQHDIDCAVIEHQQPMGGNLGVSVAFTMGRMAGGVESALSATGLPMHYTTPASWKAKAGLLKATKKQSLDRARQLFGVVPEFKRVKDSDRAEAALIAFFGLPERVMGRRAAA